MTEAQLASIKRLANTYNSTLEHTDVLHDMDGTGILGLPPGWILVNVCRTEVGKSPHECNSIIVQAGIAPDGGVST